MVQYVESATVLDQSTLWSTAPYWLDGVSIMRPAETEAMVSSFYLYDST